MEIITIIISWFVGAVSWWISSIIAPWAKWGIEKRKMQRQKQYENFNSLKKILNEKEFDRNEFSHTVEYAFIRPYLTKELVKKIEDNVFHVTIWWWRNSGCNNFKPQILDEVIRIEKKMKLI